jgi:hypothetical protein
MSFGELLYFLDERERLIIPVAPRQLRDVDMSYTCGYQIPVRCLMGMGTGMNFYLWV